MACKNALLEYFVTSIFYTSIKWKYLSNRSKHGTWQAVQNECVWSGNAIIKDKNWSKVSSSFILSKMIVKLELKIRTKLQNTKAHTKLMQQQTRTRSRWGAIANLSHAQVFDPQLPKSPPLWHNPGDRIKNSVWYVSDLLFVRTHTMFGIKNFEIDLNL